MLYDFAFTIPANTTKDAPARLDARVIRGTIHRLEVQFPSGCAGLVHVVIRRFGRQLWPSNTEGSFASDGHAISCDVSYDIVEQPTLLELVGYNDDDSYDHTVTVRFGLSVVAKAPVPPPTGTTALGAALSRILGTLKR